LATVEIFIFLKYNEYMDEQQSTDRRIKKWREKYPEKFAAEDVIFKNIHRGNRLFISTACGEPQYLVSALIKYVESHPKAFADTEIFHIWTL